MIFSFLFWRAGLFLFLFLAIKFVPLQENFLGGGKANYLSNPWLWSWVNFDGEHYLSIAWQGYSNLQYFFFPVYPLAVRAFSSIFLRNFSTYALLGVFISNTSFLIGLWGFKKLLELDYKRNIVQLTVLLLLLFPTSFYFGSFYTESLFFALSVWSFYFARNKRWIKAGVLTSLATATRVLGLALAAAILIEYIDQKHFFKRKSVFKSLKKIKPKEILGLVIAPVGILVYMNYLYSKTGDALEFFNSIGIYGEQRTAGFILFPRVLYRYLFKIIPNINYNYFPVVFTTWLELLSAIVFYGVAIFTLVSLIYKKRYFELFKIRASYLIYLIMGLLIPTFSGSFSSFPRYVLIIFPGFIILANLVSGQKKSIRLILLFLLLVGLVLATSMFTRGYWIS